MDSDVEARESLWQARELPMVTRALAGGTAESETGVGQYGLGCWRRQTYSTNNVYLHRFSRLRFCVCV